MTDSLQTDDFDDAEPADRLPKHIDRSRIVLAEGMDDKHFLMHLLPRIGLSETMWIYQFGGKDNLRNYLPAFVRASGFHDNVVSLTIIGDADDSAEDRFRSLCDSLTDCGLEAPSDLFSTTTGRPKIAIFLWPDNKNNGMLETLCLRSVESKPEMECVEPYIECLRNTSPMNRNEEKARLYAYLAAQENPSLRLGQAMKAQYFDPFEEAFEPIISFLRGL